MVKNTITFIFSVIINCRYFIDIEKTGGCIMELISIISLVALYKILDLSSKNRDTVEIIDFRKMEYDHSLKKTENITNGNN